MLKDITLGQYYPGDSVVHRLDPRVKMILMIVYIVMVFLVQGFLGYVCLAAFLAAATLLSHIRVKFLLRSIRPVLFIVVFTFLLNILFTRGEHPIVEWGILRIYWEGVRFAVFMSLRLVFLLAGTSLLTLTTSPMALTDALERLLKPLNAVHFPVHEMAMMMTIALRFIPTLLEETDKIMKAQTARGVEFDGGVLKKVRLMMPLCVPLLVSSVRKTNSAAIAAEVRGFNLRTRESGFKEYPFAGIDFAALAVAVAIAAAAIALGVLL